MDGTWLFKLDNRPERPAAASPASPAGSRSPSPTPGTSATTAAQSFLGGVGWYRKDFSCPTASKRGVVGRALRVGQLPLEGLAQRQADRQEPRRLPAVRDPPAGRAAQARRRQPPGHPRRHRAASRPTSRPPACRSIGKPTGGWWNYGGLLREVYLRKINDVDFNTVVVRPDLPCATCTGDGHLPRDAAQLRHERPARRRQRALRRPPLRHRHARRSAPSASPR